MKTLTIISHTEHYQTAEGLIVGLAPTVMEINALLVVFDHIYHLGMLHKGVAPANVLPYVTPGITFVPLPEVGGKGLKSKLAILGAMPKILNKVHNTLLQTDYFQFRAPTGIGVFVVPYLIWFYKGKGWFKYAGDWSSRKPPLAYRFQRYLLQHQSRPVTINGHWPNQPKQCLSFENPCLTDAELKQGLYISQSKVLKMGAINLCFVGRLEPAKGLDLFLNALIDLSPSAISKIGRIHIVGDGADRTHYEVLANTIDIPIMFHGFLSRDAVHAIYTQCHALVLPSATEGFPKVIAEAMNYGCIPIVSDISAISHYVKDVITGLLLPEVTQMALTNSLSHFLKLNTQTYIKMTAAQRAIVRKFTYHYYNIRITDTFL